MFKVLIVDDEQPVLDGLQHLIERHFTELAVCGRARSGNQAIEQALALQPDLVLMDVKMPGISGLDAIREIHGSLPQAQFLLVTAYERFDIAKEAFHLGVSDYVQKPINKDKFLETLEKCLSSLRKRSQQRSSEITQLEMLEASEYLLEPEFFRLIERRNRLDATEFESRLAAFFRIFNLPGSGGRLVCLQYPGIARHAEGLRTRMQYRFRVLLARDGSDRLWVFVPQPEAQDAEALATLIRGAAMPLLPDPALRIMLGSCNKPTDLDLSRQAVLAQLRREQVPGETQGFPWDAERQLVETLLYRSEGDFNRALADYARLLAESLPQAEVLAVLQRSAVVLLHAVGHRLPMDADRLGPITWADLESLSEWQESLLDWGGRLATLWNGRRAKEHTPVVEKTLSFVEKNFRIPISLEDAARAASVSAQYLSRTFSEEMHESFVNYLTRIRMNHAREMLKRGLSIKVVTHDLGYTDPNYFSRLFKRITGLTPREFART
jgi:two-component system, response regulator YesN